MVTSQTAPIETTPTRSLVLFGGYVATGLLLIAFNLRMGVAVGPVLPAIQRDLGGSSSAAGLLTTIPVFAFGVFAFFTPWLIGRIGLHRLLGLSMAAAASGIGIRMIDAPAALFAGTLVIGAAIAVGNVCMPVAIKRDFSHRTGLMMGLYTTALAIGPAVATAFTVPLMSAFGGSWRSALGFWAIPAIVAFLVWLPCALRQPAPARGAAGRARGMVPASPREPSVRRLLRDRVAWAVTGYMGLQSLTYYAGLNWISSLLQDAGTSAHAAGVLAAYAALPGVLASLFVPATLRLRPTWLIVTVSTLCSIGGFAGLLAVPSGGAVWLWMTLLGLGQGSAITLALGYIVLRSPDARHTGHLSTMAQGIGYLLAGFGPLGVGVLHGASGGWSVPMTALLVLSLAQLVVGIAASRERHVLAPSLPQEEQPA